MKQYRLIKNGRPIIYEPTHHRSFKSGYLSGYVYEHIFVAEKLLGRQLFDNEVVHHRDSNKLNNDPSNILVFDSNSAHSFYHASNLSENDLEIGSNGVNCRLTTKQTTEYTYICHHCGKMFTTSTPRRCTNKFDYCSVKCFNLSNRVVDHPSIEQLISDLDELGFYCAVGRKYGVSDNAIRKWLRKNK